jgi:hypothetical protein
MHVRGITYSKYVTTSNKYLKLCTTIEKPGEMEGKRKGKKD